MLTRATPSFRSVSIETSGVLPPTTASMRLTLTGALISLTIRSICSTERGASTKMRSAPASA
jgi:hypothetical protein